MADLTTVCLYVGLRRDLRLSLISVHMDPPTGCGRSGPQATKGLLQVFGTGFDSAKYQAPLSRSISGGRVS